MSPSSKKQRKDGGGSGETAGKICSSAGQGHAKTAPNKKQRKYGVGVADTLLKDEWRGLSKNAQSRHIKNEILAKIREMIPGPGKISENGLMLQAAARIKELEIEIDSLSNYLERLEKSENSKESADKKSSDQSMTAVIPAIQEALNGSEAIRAVLPEPTTAKGKRLLEEVRQYLSDLVQERDRVRGQIAEREKSKNPPAAGGK